MLSGLCSGPHECSWLVAELQERAVGPTSVVWLAERAQLVFPDKPQLGEARAHFWVIVSLVSPDSCDKLLGFSGGGEKRTEMILERDELSFCRCWQS